MHLFPCEKGPEHPNRQPTDGRVRDAAEIVESLPDLGGVSTGMIPDSAASRGTYIDSGGRPRWLTVWQ